MILDPATRMLALRTRSCRPEAAAQRPARPTQRLLVLDGDARAQAGASGIEVLPAYEWLLAASDED